MTINHRRGGNIRQQHEYLSAASEQQSWTCLIRPVWMCSGPAGSEQVKAGGCRARSAFQHVQNEPPTDSRDGLLKVVSRVPSPASQGGSEGGLQPDGAASKRSPQHRRNGKKKSLITFYTFFQKLLFWKKRRIFFFFFCPLFCDSNFGAAWAQVSGGYGDMHRI